MPDPVTKRVSHRGQETCCFDGANQNSRSPVVTFGLYHRHRLLHPPVTTAILFDRETQYFQTPRLYVPPLE